LAGPERAGVRNRFLRWLDPRGLTRIPGLLLGSIRVVFLSLREFLRDNGLHWAASISYSTLLSLVPLGILFFALIGTFGRLFDVDVNDVEEAYMEQGLPDAAKRAGDEIRSLIARSRSSSTGLGVIGGGFLVITAMGLFSALERAVNTLWKIRRVRNAFKRFLAFWTVVTLGPVLAGISIFATARLQAMSGVYATGVVGFLLVTAIRLLPFVLTWGTFCVFYIYLPNTKVRLGSAMLGAVVAGSAWEVAKWGFNAYVSHAVNIDRVYGALGIIPVFILWVYLTWILILLGVEVVYVHQHQRAVLAGAIVHDLELGASRELAALGLLLQVYRPFREGRPAPDPNTLSSELVLRAEAVRLLLDDLEHAGLVRRDSGGLVLPAKEANRITLGEAMQAARGSAKALADVWETPEGQRIRAAFDAAETGRGEMLSKTTLEDVLNA
jgi:membrane protein